MASWQTNQHICFHYFFEDFIHVLVLFTLHPQLYTDPSQLPFHQTLCPFFSHHAQFVLLKYSRLYGLLLECGWLIRSYTPRENWWMPHILFLKTREILHLNNPPTSTVSFTLFLLFFFFCSIKIHAGEKHWVTEESGFPLFHPLWFLCAKHCHKCLHVLESHTLTLIPEFTCSHGGTVWPILYQISKLFSKLACVIETRKATVG